MDEVLALGDLNATGVYLLRAEEPDALRLYIGETANLATRLKQHAADRDFWNEAIAFVRSGDGLDKADVQYLEARLIRLADAAEQIATEHSNRPDPSGKLEPDKEAAAEGFLENLLECLRALGIGDFEPPQSRAPEQPAPSSDPPPATVASALTASSQSLWHTLTVPSKEVKARGRQLPNGKFRVEAGATATEEEGIAESLRGLRYRAAIELRDEMIKDGRLSPRSDHQGYILTKDEEFNSPSQAEAVLAGRVGSGLANWIPENGSGDDE